MSDLALEAEVARLRDQVAKLEAARPVDMEGFRQLNDAIVNNRLGGFVREKAHPKWVTNTIKFAVLTPALLVALFFLYVALTR